MRAHVWLEGGYGMVTGCMDPDVALPLLAAELADRVDWFMWGTDSLADATEAVTRPVLAPPRCYGLA